MLSHFIHGDQIDENDSKYDKEDWQKALLNPQIHDHISRLIFNLIPEVNRLKKLFISWSMLKPEERNIMDIGASSYSGLLFYNQLIEAMRRWEFLQDTEGAPGCEPGMTTINDPAVEQALVKTVIAVENILSHLEMKKSKEILRCTSSAELVIDSIRYVCEGVTDCTYNEKSSCTRGITRSVSLDDIITIKKPTTVRYSMSFIS